MTERKYSVAAVGLRIDGFLQATLENAGIELDYEIMDAAPGEDDFPAMSSIRPRIAS